MSPDIQTADAMLHQIAMAPIDDDWAVSCLALADMLEEHHGRAGDLAAGLRWMAEHRERPVQTDQRLYRHHGTHYAGWRWVASSDCYPTFLEAVRHRGAECRG